MVLRDCAYKSASLFFVFGLQFCFYDRAHANERLEWKAFDPRYAGTVDVEPLVSELKQNYRWIGNVPGGSNYDVKVYIERALRALSQIRSVKISEGLYEKLWSERGKLIDTQLDIFDKPAKRQLSIDNLNKLQDLRSFLQKIASLKTNHHINIEADRYTDISRRANAVVAMLGRMLSEDDRQELFKARSAFEKEKLLVDWQEKAKQGAQIIDMNHYNPSKSPLQSPAENQFDVLDSVRTILAHKADLDNYIAVNILNRNHDVLLNKDNLEGIAHHLSDGHELLKNEIIVVLESWKALFKLDVIEDEPKGILLQSIKVQEASPAIALFRGAVAGDCSSGGSENYPLLPSQRMLFVWKDPQKAELKPNAYVQLVRVNGGSSGSGYILSDINGNLTQREVYAVIKYLHDHGRQYGITKLGAIRLQSRAGRLNNDFTNMAMQQYFSKEVQSVTLDDQALRQVVPHSHNYDVPAHFDVWHPVIPELIAAIPFVLKAHQLEGFQNTAAKPKDIAPKVDSKIDLEIATQKELAQEVEMITVYLKNGVDTNEAGFNQKIVPWLNIEGRPLEEFRTQLNNYLKERYPVLNQSERKKLLPLASLGMLRASDIEDQAHHAKALETALGNLFRINPLHDLILNRFLMLPQLREFWFRDLSFVLDRVKSAPEIFEKAYQLGIFDLDPQIKLQVLVRLILCDAKKEEAANWIKYLEGLPNSIDIKIDPELVNFLEHALRNADEKDSENYCLAAYLLIQKISAQSFQNLEANYLERLKKQIKKSILYEKNLDIVEKSINALNTHRFFSEEEKSKMLRSMVEDRKNDRQYDQRYEMLANMLGVAQELEEICQSIFNRDRK